VQRYSGKRSTPKRGGAGRVGREREHRVGERLRLAGRYQQTGLAVAHKVLQPADRRRDHRARAFHRLERDHPETLAERRNHDRERLLDRALNRRHVPEEPHRFREAELACEILQPVLERAAPGNVESRLGAFVEHAAEGAQQDDVTLDRDQASDAEEAQLVAFVRRRLRTCSDSVVDDLEVGLQEAFRLGQVAREAP
jgi:hypothetical protein